MTVRPEKASLEIDLDKVVAAQEVLGTKSLADTVDAALIEVVKSRQRRRLVEYLFTPGALALDDPGTMADAWRC